MSFEYFLNFDKLISAYFPRKRFDTSKILNTRAFCQVGTSQAYCNKFNSGSGGGPLSLYLYPKSLHIQGVIDIVPQTNTMNPVHDSRPPSDGIFCRFFLMFFNEFFTFFKLKCIKTLFYHFLRKK